ncbi:MAG: flagellar assembly protein FliW [Limnochordales bacterium]|nr:flagellar assembly protein FliW [Limnochordales bacterium]
MPTVTTRFGTFEFRTDEIITFPRGIIGFEGIREYILKPLEGTPFQVLQAVDGSGLAFIVIEPRLFLADYAVPAANDLEDAAIYCIVTVPNDPAQMTANLRAPLVIDRTQRRGQQVILEEAYPIRFPLLQGKAVSGDAVATRNSATA